MKYYVVDYDSVIDEWNLQMAINFQVWNNNPRVGPRARIALISACCKMRLKWKFVLINRRSVRNN